MLRKVYFRKETPPPTPYTTNTTYAAVVAENEHLKRENEVLQAANKTLRRAFPYKCGQKVYTVYDGRIFRHIIREIRFTSEDVYIDGISYKNVYTCLKKAQAAQRRSEAE